MSSVDFTVPGTTDLTSLAPRVLKINESTDNSDQHKWSAYGLFYVAATDRLYVSAGYSGSSTLTGSCAGASGDESAPAQNSVKVYDNVSDPSVSGVYTPTRVLHWSNQNQFYPPQPLWVTRH